MCWSTVMMQLPVFHHPEVWSFAPNCIMESAENLLIVLFCHCLSFQYILVMHNSTDIKEHSITLILLCSCRARCVAILESVEPLLHLCFPHSIVSKRLLNLRIVSLWKSQSFWQNLIYRSIFAQLFQSSWEKQKFRQPRITTPHLAPSRQGLAHSNAEKQFRHSHYAVFFHCAQWHCPSVTTVLGKIQGWIYFRLALYVYTISVSIQLYCNI